MGQLFHSILKHLLMPLVLQMGSSGQLLYSLVILTFILSFKFMLSWKSRFHGSFTYQSRQMQGRRLATFEIHRWRLGFSHFISGCSHLSRNNLGAIHIPQPPPSILTTGPPKMGPVGARLLLSTLKWAKFSKLFTCSGLIREQLILNFRHLVIFFST